MTQLVAFGEILEAADRLTSDEQQELVAILQRRLAEASRDRIAADIEESRREFADGKCVPVSPDDLMREILG